MRPTIIVLAAGLGSRFGAAGHKLTQAFADDSVLGTTIDHALASGLPVVVVTTEALSALVRAHVALPDIVLLPSVGSQTPGLLGMGFSISAGVAARPEAPGWLVLPGDMPLVSPATLQAVAQQLDVHPVAYAQHQGRRGHPVGFAAELYSELVMLTGDEGARRLIGRYPAFGVDVDDAGVLVDIDTSADLSHARSLHRDASAAVRD